MSKVVIASINLNKRLGNQRVLANVQKWLENLRPSLLLTQEPWSHACSSHIEIDGYAFLGGNSFVAAYCTVAPVLKYTLAKRNERWLTLTAGNLKIHNLYFPPDSSKARSELFKILRSKLTFKQSYKHILFGDFNMAPRKVDGLHGGEVSKWTTEKERRLFNDLLTKLQMVDLYAEKYRHTEYTFERQIKGKLNQFRCDLAIVDKTLIENLAIQLDHNTRRGEARFSDHSAVIVALESSGD